MPYEPIHLFHINKTNEIFKQTEVLTILTASINYGHAYLIITLQPLSMYT